MDFNWDSILSNPLVNNVVNKATDSILGVKQVKPPAAAAAPVISAQAPAMPSGMSTNTMILIGAGVLAVIGGLFFFLKKK